MKRKILLSAAVLGVIAIQGFLRKNIDVWLGIRVDVHSPAFVGSEFARVIYSFCWYFIPALIVLFSFYQPSQIPGELGINRNFLKGLSYGILASIPMFVGYAMMGTLADQTELPGIFLQSAQAGFNEEVFFRAFIFGQLFFRAGWGYIPAMLVNGGLFGLGHLYQSEGGLDPFFILLITVGGAIGFSLMFAETRKNVWFLIFLHFFMDFSWGIFDMSQNVIGGWGANIPRILTIIIAVGLTIKISKSYGSFFCKPRKRWVNSGLDLEEAAQKV